MNPKDLRYSDFSWDKNRLYLNGELMAELIQATVETTGWHPGFTTGWKGFFHIMWPDGTVTDDVFNLTRAKDNAVKTTLHSLQSGPVGP